MSWVIAARIPITEQEQDSPEHVGQEGKTYIEIYSGLRTIALSHNGMFQIFEWVEPDVTATYIGLICNEPPLEDTVRDIKAVHPFIGNVELNDDQMKLAVHMAEDPE